MFLIKKQKISLPYEESESNNLLDDFFWSAFDLLCRFYAHRRVYDKQFCFNTTCSILLPGSFTQKWLCMIWIILCNTTWFDFSFKIKGAGHKVNSCSILMICLLIEARTYVVFYDYFNIFFWSTDIHDLNTNLNYLSSDVLSLYCIF